MAHVCIPLQSLVQYRGQSVVMTCSDRSTTAAQLHSRVALLSRTLTDQLGIATGQRAAFLGLNTDHLFCSLLAVLDAGATCCPLNWRWSATELAAAISLLEPSVLFVDDHCLALAQQACRHLSAAHPVAVVWMQARVAAAAPVCPGAWPECFQCHTLQGLVSPGLAAGIPDSVADLSTAAPARPLQLLQPGQDQPALIVFTSGTTGTSKGVMLSHSSITHQSVAKMAVVQYTCSDVYLHMAPLFHIGGLSSAFAVLMAGGSHVFMPHYSAATALQLIKQHSVTSLIAVPAMMQDLTQAADAQGPAAAAAAAAVPILAPHTAAAPVAGAVPAAIATRGVPQQQGLQLPSLQRVLVGAGGMPLRLQHRVMALFPNAQLQTAYGMTEACSSITFVSVPQQQRLMATAASAATATAAAAAAAAARANSTGPVNPPAAGVCVGQPGPGIAVRIHPVGVSANGSNSGTNSSSCGSGQCPNQASQQLLPSAAPGVVGEVCTRGPHIMLGYWRDAAATRQALRHGGWLHTGDLGYLDVAGNVWLVGRLKDMVKTGGENVMAAEVESVLLSHPGVAAAAVFGLEHQRLGEQVAAAVVLQRGWRWADAEQQLPRDCSHRPEQQQQATTEAQALQASQQGQQLAHACELSALRLQQHCRAALLSPYKLPRVVVCVRQLPLNSSGKVVKAVLKQQVQQMLAAARMHGGGSGHTGDSNGCSSNSSSTVSSRAATWSGLAAGSGSSQDAALLPRSKL